MATNQQRRENITLQNDPNFDPFMPLPGLDLVTALSFDGDLGNLFASQKTDSQKLSQFTPLASQNSSSGRGNISINLPESIGDSYHLPSDLGPNSPAGWKPNYQSEFDPPLNHGHDSLGGFGLEFDIDGNLIEDDIPAPPLPGNDEQEGQVFQQQILDAGDQVQVAQQDGEPGVVIMSEQPLPDAEAFPSRKAPTQHHSSATQSSEDSATGRVAAAKGKRKTRMKKANTMMDANPQLLRKDMKNGQLNYVELMDEIRNRPKVVSIAQAKKNALAFLYGGGVARIGAPAIADIDGFAHPLAEDFAGRFFKARVLDREVKEDVEITPKRRRRGHSEAFAED